MPFAHRRLIVYQQAVSWVVRVFASTERLSSRWRGVVDQVRRSAVSIPLNIAEGISETNPREQRRFLRIARRSAAECDACYHILESAGAISESGAAEAADTLNRLAAMLTALIRQCDKRLQKVEP